MAAGVTAAAPRSLREAAAASVKELARIASLGPDPARRVAEVPGALPALVAAVAAGNGAAVPGSQDYAAADSAVALGWISMAGPDSAARLAEVPGVLPVLIAAVVDRVPAGIHCVAVLDQIASASPELARRVAEEPRAPPALVAAVADGAAATAHPVLQLVAEIGAAVLDHITQGRPGPRPPRLRGARCAASAGRPSGGQRQRSNSQLVGAGQQCWGRPSARAPRGRPSRGTARPGSRCGSRPGRGNASRACGGCEQCVRAGSCCQGRPRARAARGRGTKGPAGASFWRGSRWQRGQILRTCTGQHHCRQPRARAARG